MIRDQLLPTTAEFPKFSRLEAWNGGQRGERGSVFVGGAGICVRVRASSCNVHSDTCMSVAVSAHNEACMSRATNVRDDVHVSGAMNTDEAHASGTASTCNKGTRAPATRLT